MTDLFQEPEDATPLDPDLRKDLLQTWITNRSDLNEAEQENILKGSAWARRNRGTPKATDILTDNFVRTLHKQMFGEVWRWAGSYRQNKLNIGIDPHLVPAAMPDLLSNVRFWIEQKTYPADEIAVRLHHGLTQIHAFPNGKWSSRPRNGRPIDRAFRRQNLHLGQRNLAGYGNVADPICRRAQSR
jgi:Fic-DOC domain mobile mystery protein B